MVCGEHLEMACYDRKCSEKQCSHLKDTNVVGCAKTSECKHKKWVCLCNNAKGYFRLDAKYSSDKKSSCVSKDDVECQNMLCKSPLLTNNIRLRALFLYSY